MILRNREGQITEIIVTDRFENLAPPASKEYHHPQHCFQFSALIDSLIALTSLGPSQLAIIYLHGVRVRPSFQSRDQGMVNILLPQYFWSVPLKMHFPNQSFSTLDLLDWHFMDFASLSRKSWCFYWLWFSDIYGVKLSRQSISTFNRIQTCSRQ